ncbi:benzaldehyde dehydrogenase [Streptomyces spongiae]|uniref:Aldehyde dehydrogenase family protein n=1 Tax=Streptomyces spongiae TaxID=565072 RepID=A0A5N8XJU0_9ACTN|nr:benzaldehyde dehydrogenase [Streptomyces spongiae]MPY59524.1 aldehyde dehydrogenase family protein [Streptomyces spongiae]
MASLLNDGQWSTCIRLDTWCEGQGGKAAVIEPATGQELATVGLAGPADVHRAAGIAAEAQRHWAATPPEERAVILRRAGDLWGEHAEEVAEWLVRESGSVRLKAGLEVHTAAQECYEASALPTHPAGDVLASASGRWSLSRRRPVGVVSVISPFNFPLILSIRSVAPALALGNAVLLKPDPRTAVCGGVVLSRIFEEAGLPTGLLQVLPGGAETGEAAVTAAPVRVVSFTGSTAAGRRVGALGAQHLKRTHLELGGNNALIVLPGADVERAASAGAFGTFLHQGQICMTTGRHLVHESLYEQYLALLADKASRLPVGDPRTAEVALGPLIDAEQRDRVHEVVQDSVCAGAELLTGGQYEDLFYRPTVLADVRHGHRAWAEEVFGPVAPVRSFSDIDEAVAVAAATDYGLSLGILGEVGAAMRVADAVPAGLVHINEQTVADEAHVPFGGVGASGTGARFGGSVANIEAFTETQWLTARADIAAYPF